MQQLTTGYEKKTPKNKSEIVEIMFHVLYRARYVLMLKLDVVAWKSSVKIRCRKVNRWFCMLRMCCVCWCC